MDSSHDKVLAMLSVLRNDFLESLPRRCEQIEILILQFVGQTKQSAAFEEVYRLVHSLKGAGSTHGLPLVSTICHSFEDLLINQDGFFDEQFVSRALTLLDLLKQISALSTVNEGVLLEDVTAKYHHFQQAIRADFRSVLLLESSRTMQLLLQKFLENFQVRTTVMHDGFLALQRLLHEPFDLIIVSTELMHLKGPALISAVQLNKGFNSDTPVILLSSKAEFSFQHFQSLVTLPRSPALPSLLEPVIAGYCERRGGSSSIHRNI